VLDGDYVRAELIINRSIEAGPSAPLSWAARGALYYTAFLDLKRDSLIPLLEHSLEKSFEFSLRQRNSREGLFSTALSYGLKAMYYSQEKYWWRALQSGLRSYRSYQRLIHYFPDCFDAYAGLGNFHYWTSRYQWLPGITDTRNLGIQELKMAIERGEYLNSLAAYNLVWIYYVEGDYLQGLGLTEKILKEHPKNRLFMRAQGDIYFRMENFNEAQIVYENLIKLFEADQTIDYLQVRLKLAQIYYQRMNFIAARETCQSIIQTPLSTQLQKKLERELSDTRRLIQLIQEERPLEDRK